MAPLPQHGPQRSGHSAGTMSGFPPFRFPRESGGLGTMVVQLPRSGPQCSRPSTGAVLELS